MLAVRTEDALAAGLSELSSKGLRRIAKGHAVPAMLHLHRHNNPVTFDVHARALDASECRVSGSSGHSTGPVVFRAEDTSVA